MSFVWICLLAVIVGLPVLFIGLSMYRYYRIQQLMPKPPYKKAAFHPEPRSWRNDEVTFTWIGHSTVLMNLNGYKIITDPVFSSRVGVKIGPFVIGPKRHTGPALLPEEIEDIDLILLSHAHMDHVDFPSLQKLVKHNPVVITASGTGKLLRKFSFQDVHELGGKQQIELANGVRVTAVPVKHWGNRFPWNTGYGYTGYLIEKDGVRVLFAGDTAYTDTFRQMQDLPYKIDVAILPIGAYAPDSFQRSHCTPEQAWQMFLDTGANWFFPVHWDTIVLSYEPVKEPLERLLQAANDQSDRIVIRQHGQVFQLQKQPQA